MTHHANDKNAISPDSFPALRNFLRGYFHQDMKDEYGSAPLATRQFCQDASVEDRAAVSADWARFTQQTSGLPLDQINQLLTVRLGSSYALQQDDWKSISAILCPENT